MNLLVPGVIVTTTRFEHIDSRGNRFSFKVPVQGHEFVFAYLGSAKRGEGADEDSAFTRMHALGYEPRRDAEDGGKLRARWEAWEKRREP